MIRKEKATEQRPMRTISFFLLLFWQQALFFRPHCSFLRGNRAPFSSACSWAEMSSSYATHLLFRSLNENIKPIICNNPCKVKKILRNFEFDLHNIIHTLWINLWINCSYPVIYTQDRRRTFYFRRFPGGTTCTRLFTQKWPHQEQKNPHYK